MTVTQHAPASSYMDEMRAAKARMADLASTYPADVRTLYEAWSDSTDVSRIIGQLLRSIHRKRGQIDLHEVRRLDTRNGAAFLRLVESFSSPSMFSDRGLSQDPMGNPILSEDEIAQLFADE